MKKMNLGLVDVLPKGIVFLPDETLGDTRTGVVVWT